MYYQSEFAESEGKISCIRVLKATIGEEGQKGVKIPLQFIFLKGGPERADGFILIVGTAHQAIQKRVKSAGKA